MTTRHPRYHQGRKDTRLKPVLSIPDRPTHFHKRVDKVLSREQARATPAPEESRPQPHRHKYKRVIRECEDGIHRVVQCACGHYVMTAKP